MPQFSIRSIFLVTAGLAILLLPLRYVSVAVYGYGLGILTYLLGPYVIISVGSHLPRWRSARREIMVVAVCLIWILGPLLLGVLQPRSCGHLAQLSLLTSVLWPAYGAVLGFWVGNQLRVRQ